MPQEISLSDVKNLVGTEVGISDWITVTQNTIDSFAGARTTISSSIRTRCAPQPKPRSAARLPMASCRSLLSAMNYNCLPRVREQTMGINYGFDKVRFMTPVKSGAKVRGRFTMAEARFRGAGMLMVTYEVTVDIEGERKPALTATWLTIIQFDPKDRPEDA